MGRLVYNGTVQVTPDPEFFGPQWAFRDVYAVTFTAFNLYGGKIVRLDFDGEVIATAASTLFVIDYAVLSSQVLKYVTYKPFATGC